MKKLVDLDQQSSLTTIFVDFTSDDAEIQLQIPSSFKSVSRAERPFSKMTLGNFSILLLTQIPVA